jgi:ribosomal-protein-alanine N-acetyltransferase
VRPMIKADIPQILEIESVSFPAPWAEHAFTSELTNNFAVYFVLDSEKRVIGYTGLWLFSAEAHVTTIAVHPDHRGQGCGRVLMQAGVEHAIKQGVETMILEVRPTNVVAINLYRGIGFRNIGRRKNYYMETHEDALVMMKKLKYQKARQGSDEE